MSSMGFDSFEPFCTSHTVASAKSQNWSHSDCQFSNTLAPKSEVTRNRK